MTEQRKTCVLVTGASGFLDGCKELGACVVGDPVAVDDRIMACAGPAFSLEISWRLVDGLLVGEHCAEIRRLMCVDKLN